MADVGLEGTVGYITPELIKQSIAPPSLGSKVKVFVCGESQATTFVRILFTSRNTTQDHPDR